MVKVEDDRGWDEITTYKIVQNYPVLDVIEWVIMFHFTIPK
jgi:hypothetical protein